MIISDDGSKLAFNKRELAILTSMMADAGRPELAALWFHGGRAKAWATDGLRAVMVEREQKPPRANPKARSVAIPAVTAQHVAKTAGARDLVVVDIGGKIVTLDVREPKQSGTEIESFEQIAKETRSKHAVSCKRHVGGYDSIDFVFPTPHKRGSKGAVIAVNANLLGPLVMLAKVAEPNGEIWINVGPELDPLLVAARADVWTVWRMVIMPRRGDGWPEIKRVEPAAASNPGEQTSPKPAGPVNQGELAPPAEPAAANQGEVSSPAEPATSTATAKPAKPKTRARGGAKLRAAS